MSNEPTREQMNEAICDFMGGYRKIERPDYHINVYKGPDGIEWETGTHLKYHSSWDWLMPVWKKAGKILFDIRGDLSDEKYLSIHRITKAFIYACQTVDIEGAHMAVYNAIQNIQWYNKQQSNEQSTTGNKN